MLDKIKRFLLRQKGIEFIKKSEQSSSLYFSIGDKIIRVSDHIPTSQYRPEELHILVTVNSESFTILVNNRVAIIPNYSKLKEYIKFYILTVGVMGRTVYSVVTKERIVERVQEVTKEVPIYREVEGLNPDEQAILSKYRRISPDQHRISQTPQSLLKRLRNIVRRTVQPNPFSYFVVVLKSLRSKLSARCVVS